MFLCIYVSYVHVSMYLCFYVPMFLCIYVSMYLRVSPAPGYTFSPVSGLRHVSCMKPRSSADSLLKRRDHRKPTGKHRFQSVDLSAIGVFWGLAALLQLHGIQPKFRATRKSGPANRGQSVSEGWESPASDQVPNPISGIGMARGSVGAEVPPLPRPTPRHHT